MEVSDSGAPIVQTGRGTLVSTGIQVRTVNEKVIGLILALFFLASCALLTKSKPEAWNDMSRIAAIESLAERGTWVIDQSPWTEQMQDKVFLNGHFHSDKMPLLSVLGAGVYAVLRSTVGASLAPDCATSGKVCGYYWLTLVLVGIPAAMLLWLFFDYALGLSVPLWQAIVATGALAWATMLFPYSLILNHHVPAAVCLFASFYALAHTNRNSREGVHKGPRNVLLSFTREGGTLAIAGVLAGLAVSFDALASILVASLCLIAFARARGNSIYFALGMLLPLAVTALLNYQNGGTIIPAYMLTYGYTYPGSQWPATIAGNGTPDDVAQYAFKMLFGAQGLFAYEPILFFALAGLIVVLVKNARSMRLEAACIGLGFMALAIYLISSTGNLGGVAYGERWFIGALPLMWAFVFFSSPLAASRFRPVFGVIFAFFLLSSILSSYQGALHPWLYSQPPFHLTRSAAGGTFGFRWNLKFPLR